MTAPRARDDAVTGIKEPCAACPWRASNHGKRHEHHFYTKRNLRRLWNQIRRGGRPQSCHPTDPGHPDHGAKADAEPVECQGSAILVMRELARLKELGEDVGAYLAEARSTKGLTRDGLLYFVVRLQFGHVPPPFGPEGGPLPVVSEQQVADTGTFSRPPA